MDHRMRIAPLILLLALAGCSNQPYCNDTGPTEQTIEREVDLSQCEEEFAAFQSLWNYYLENGAVASCYKASEHGKRWLQLADRVYEAQDSDYLQKRERVVQVLKYREALEGYITQTYKVNARYVELDGAYRQQLEAKDNMAAAATVSEIMSLYEENLRSTEQYFNKDNIPEGAGVYVQKYVQDDKEMIERYRKLGEELQN